MQTYRPTDHLHQYPFPLSKNPNPKTQTNQESIQPSNKNRQTKNTKPPRFSEGIIESEKTAKRREMVEIEISIRIKIDDELSKSRREVGGFEGR